MGLNDDLGAKLSGKDDWWEKFCGKDDLGETFACGDRGTVARSRKGSFVFVWEVLVLVIQLQFVFFFNVNNEIYSICLLKSI